MICRITIPRIKNDTFCQIHDSSNYYFSTACVKEAWSEFHPSPNVGMFDDIMKESRRTGVITDVANLLSLTLQSLLSWLIFQA